MYAYCFNNPVNMADANGNWPKWINTIVNVVKKIVKTVCIWIRKVKEKVEKTIGFTVQVDQEVPSTSTPTYHGIVSYETGTGYNKSFDTGKSVNVYKTISDLSRDVYDDGVGIDFDYNGYGVSVQMGDDDSFSVNIQNQSFEWGRKPFGRNYFKYSHIDSSGVYLYQKVTVNNLELAATILAIYYQPYLVPVAGAGLTRSAYGY